jgi:hypothetical protein
VKYCPLCGEFFEDEEMKYCTFDGSSLLDCAQARRLSIKKLALLTLLALVAVGAATLLLVSRSPAPPQSGAPLRLSLDLKTESPIAAEGPESLMGLPRPALLAILPKEALNQFRHGLVEDLRVITSSDAEYVTLIGPSSNSHSLPAWRLLILKREGGAFSDVTAEALPAAYSGGALPFPSSAYFDPETGSRLIVRQKASSNKIVYECDLCEHAYQIIALQWRKDRYVESERKWENDPYTAVYVFARALKDGRIDAAARPLIDQVLDPVLLEGLVDPPDGAWVVEKISAGTSELPDQATYILRGEPTSIRLRVAKMNGQWKVVEASAQ